MKKYSFFITMFFLCCGYFVDFYDLTIFSACYANIIADLFNIHEKQQIQSTYLLITNFYNAGIVLGAISFGILADKFGRAYIIRYSILIYSLATIISIFAKDSLALFIVLRFITGFGLANEFATSSVLIAEISNSQQASHATKWLYFCGILGGVTATLLGKLLPWQVVFFLGGSAGLIVFICRKQIVESYVFKLLTPEIKKGNIILLFTSKEYLVKYLRLFAIYLPFGFTISVMFMLIGFMNTSSLQQNVFILLMGFFIGNLISTFLSGYIVNYFKSHNVYFWINSILFVTVLSLFELVNNDYFPVYALLIGLLGGGLPTTWIQVVTKSYPTEVRATAANCLFASGRGSGILFNLLWMQVIIDKTLFISTVHICVIVVFIITSLAIYKTKNVYDLDISSKI